MAEETEYKPREIMVDIFIRCLKSSIPDEYKLDDDNITKIATDIEKGIYNYTISYSEGKNVIKKWDNPIFMNIYNIIFCYKFQANNTQ